MNKSDAAATVYATAVPVDPSIHVAAVGSAPVESNQFVGVNPANIQAANAFLEQKQFPPGLRNLIVDNVSKMPYRFFIIDDSGSMGTSDGKKLQISGNRGKMIACSRWSELTEALKFHVELATKLAAPTEFRLLNGAAPICVGTGDADTDAAHYTALMGLFDDSPNGITPLCRHIREVVAKIRTIEDQLRASGQKACVIIASDGEASDGSVAEAMRPLKDMPVWVVVRLCTDEDRVVNYWNNVDQELELSMDVLDDLSGEAKEVKQVNPWLTYGEQMHRLREWGVHMKEFDLLDESKLTKEQVWKMAQMIYGGHKDQWPHPEIDFSGFCTELQKKNRETPKVWDTNKGAMMEWIEVSRVQSFYGSGCVIM